MSDNSLNPVIDAAYAYQRTAALVAAVKLDIFTTIGSGMITAEELASRTAASTRGLRILCDFLTVIDLLKKNGSRYSLTQNAKIFLDGSSPFAMGSIVDFVAAPEMLELFFRDPTSYVRRGGSDGLSNIAPNHPVWIRFARAMAPLAAATAKRVASYVAALPDPPNTVLDIAAGHGLYGIEVARSLPDAFVTAVDSPGVLSVACANAKAAGIDERYRMLAGNALELEWGHNFDLILLSNFLHHFDAKTCAALLRKAKASLAIDGQALAVEFVPNDDRISPPLPAMFAFLMLASTPGGDAYTAAEFDEMGRHAGFRAATVRPLPPTPQTLIIFEN